MNDFLNFIKEIFLFQNNDSMKVGLAQFKKQPTITAVKKDVSITNKDVKLSDLMRRVS